MPRTEAAHHRALRLAGDLENRRMWLLYSGSVSISDLFADHLEKCLKEPRPKMRFQRRFLLDCLHCPIYDAGPDEAENGPLRLLREDGYEEDVHPQI